MRTTGFAGNSGQSTGKEREAQGVPSPHVKIAHTGLLKLWLLVLGQTLPASLNSARQSYTSSGMKRATIVSSAGVHSRQFGLLRLSKCSRRGPDLRCCAWLPGPVHSHGKERLNPSASASAAAPHIQALLRLAGAAAPEAEHQGDQRP